MSVARRILMVSSASVSPVKYDESSTCRGAYTHCGSTGVARQCFRLRNARSLCPTTRSGVECGVAASCGWSRRVSDASRRVEHGRLRVVYGHDHRAPRKTHFASRQRSRPVSPFPRLRRRGDLLRRSRVQAFSIAVSFSGSSGCCSTKWHLHSSRRAGRWW